MTHRERVKAAIAFQKTDRIPVGPYMANHCSVAMGYNLKDCYTNAQNLADAQFKAWELYGQDIITVQSDNYYIPEGFGCIIRMPENANHTPSLIKPALDSLADVGRLPRLDPYRDGRMHVFIDAMKLLRDKVKEGVYLRSCGVGPFTLASQLRGTEAFLLETIETMVRAAREYGVNTKNENYETIHKSL